MRIRVGERYEEWDAEKLAARRAQAREADARYQPDPDEGWLTIWARNQTYHLYHLIEGILTEPEGTAEVPAHCGKPLRRFHGAWGDFYRCRRCAFKGGYATVHGGRKRREVEWLTETYRKAVDMGPNGNYFVCRESEEPLRVTAGQMGLGR